MERSHAYGHAAALASYRQAPQHMIAVLDAGGFQMHTQLHRAAQGTENTPQTVLLARRRH